MASNPPTRNRVRRLIAGLIIAIAAAGGVVIGVGSIRTPTSAQDVSAASSVAPITLPAIVRIGSFNIHSGVGDANHEDLVLTAKTLEGLDVIGLNEVRGSLTSPNQIQKLEKLTNLGGEFFPAERQYWHDAFGNALLSKLPITSWRRIPLRSPQAGARKNVTIVHLAGGQFTVVLTHITRSADQMQQLREVSKLFLDQPEPAVLLGDLNATSEDPVIHGLISTPGVLNPLDTIHPESAGKHIDWILARGVKVRNAGYRDLKASDHPLVWAELEFPAPPK